MGTSQVGVDPVPFRTFWGHPGEGLTISTGVCCQYFTQFKVEQEPMQVGGLRYPIERYFLDDVASLVPSLARPGGVLMGN